MLQERMPSRFVGFAPGVFMVVGLLFKSERDSIMNSGFEAPNYNFQVSDVEKPLDILSALHMSEQRILN